MFKCLNCGKSIEQDLKDKIRCPFCGYRILVKEKPKTIVKVPAK